MRRVGRVIAAIAAFGSGISRFSIFRCPMCASAYKNPESTAFMDLRVREARAEGRDLRLRASAGAVRSDFAHLKRAVLVAEDAGFWGHQGIDLEEIKKSLEADWERGVSCAARAPSRSSWQKTCTSRHAQPASQTHRAVHHPPPRARAEQDTIFELYLNNIEWGDAIWGAEAAAQHTSASRHLR